MLPEEEWDKINLNKWQHRDDPTRIEYREDRDPPNPIKSWKDVNLTRYKNETADEDAFLLEAPNGEGWKNLGLYFERVRWRLKESGLNYIDLLWGEEPPGTGWKMVETFDRHAGYRWRHQNQVDSSKDVILPNGEMPEWENTFLFRWTSLRFEDLLLPVGHEPTKNGYQIVGEDEVAMVRWCSTDGNENFLLPYGVFPNARGWRRIEGVDRGQLASMFFCPYFCCCSDHQTP